MAAYRSIRDLDWLMLFLVCALCGLGVLQIFSATYDTHYSDAWWKQVIWIVAGLIAMWIATLIDYHTLLGQTPVLYVLSVVTLIATYALGMSAFGSRRWIGMRDAMPSGGTLNIETARKYVNPGSRNGTAGIRGGWYFILTVTDTGKGIEEEARSRIFEAFFSTKPAGAGTGLGLAIVNAIIRKYGGQISVKTQLGAGTSFHLYFPVGSAS